jgi:hypothetical protein
MGQAMNECQVGGRYNAGSSVLSKLAGVSPGQRYAWHYWYGKSFGTVITEGGTQYFDVNYTGSNAADLGYSLYLYKAGSPAVVDGTNWFGATGGEHTAPVGNWPGVPGRPVQGFFRSGTNITFLVVNGSMDGVTFQSAIGDNVTLTNDVSYSVALGPNLWTFYGASNAVNQGAPRTYTVNFVGNPNRAQPPAGYVDGKAPATNPDPGGGGGGNGA